MLQTDLPEEVTKQVIHDRHNDLAQIEQAFGSCTTGGKYPSSIGNELGYY
jgi:hypothetical protein